MSEDAVVFNQGFTCGRLWEQMVRGEAEVMAKSLRDVCPSRIERAAAASWAMTFETRDRCMGDRWVEVIVQKRGPWGQPVQND